MRFCLALLAAFTLTAPVRADAVNTALSDAISAFSDARPQLGSNLFGVDIGAYGDALISGDFTSPHWGEPAMVEIVSRNGSGGSCESFAAYVSIPPQNGRVDLVLCPEFYTPGADALRRLTILHEMVHVVAGPDECRAMAFAARIEQIALGRHTPVDRYWQANGCETSSFSLP